MKRKALIFFFVLLTGVYVAKAQEKTITGTVVDKERKAPVSDVSIQIEGTSNGVATDANGKFTLKAAVGSYMNITSIGYVSQRIQVTASNTYNIQLEEDSKNLQEVVITSFGIQRDKKTLGYGVSTVSSDNLTKAPTPDITNALAGKVAGVQVSGSGGGFTSSNVTIRGFSSITGNNQPLYVIDGVPVDNGGGSNSINAGVSGSSRAADINPEDIESMSVLKGAAATVLYGSRAASGVILITTKKGKAGTKNVVSFTSTTTLGSINLFPEYQNE